MVTQQALLDHAALCSRVLRRTTNLKERLILRHLRDLWQALAVDGLHQKDLDEQVDMLREVEANFLAQITRH